MDYKYIEQLLERYWRCETSLQEEEILRMFFLQENIPANLQPYRHLFTYEQNEKTVNVLGDDFDQKILGMVEEDEPVKARIITMRQRLMPLFKAAAVVAIILTLGNAVMVMRKMPFRAQQQWTNHMRDHPLQRLILYRMTPYNISYRCLYQPL